MVYYYYYYTNELSLINIGGRFGYCGDVASDSYPSLFRTDSATENEDSQDSMAEDIGTAPVRWDCTTFIVLNDIWPCYVIAISFIKLLAYCAKDRSVMTYKIISKQCPESLWHKYDHRTQHSNYRTRNCRDLQIPRNNLEYVKKGFHYSALKAWNEIPINIRELPTLSKFKKQLKSYYTC